MSETTAAEAAAAEGTEGTPPAGTEEQTAERTFTQADVDRIVAERLARAEKKEAKAEQEAEATQAEAIEAAVTAAVEEREASLRAEFARERVADKVEAMAAGRFADVEDARLRLASRVDEFVKDGQVDSEAITKALDEVLDKHPHLAAQTKPQTPSASRAGIGTVGSEGKPTVAPGMDRLRAAYGSGD